jgi:hypothetical protein
MIGLNPDDQPDEPSFLDSFLGSFFLGSFFLGSVIATLEEPISVLLGKEIASTTSNHDLQSRSPASCAGVPPLLVDGPRSSPGSHLRLLSVDDNCARCTVRATAAVDEERLPAFGRKANRYRGNDQQNWIRGRQSPRPGKIGESALRRWWFTKGNEANPLPGVTPTHEEWALYRIRAEQPLDAGEYPLNSFGIARRTAPQRDLTAGYRRHLFGHEAELLDPPRIVTPVLIKSPGCDKPGVELPAKPFDNERSTPGSVVAPPTHKTLPFARCDLA